MKRFYKSIFNFIIVICMMLSCVSCGKTQSDEQVQEVTSNHNLNPLGITTYEERKDSGVVAKIGANGMIGEQYLYGLELLSFDEDGVLVSYMTSNVPPIENEMEYESDFTSKQKLVLLSTEDYQIQKTITIPENVYIQRLDNALSVESFNAEGSTITTYDHQLNIIGSFPTPQTAIAYVSGDGKRVYYGQERNAYVHYMENSADVKLKIDGNFLLESLDGVLTAEGTDYLLLTAKGPDYNNYRVIFDTYSGKVLRTFSLENSYDNIEGNTYIQTIFGEMYPEKWIVGISEEQAFDYIYNGNNAEVYKFHMNGQNLLFSYFENDSLYISYFDYETGELLGTASFPAEEMKYAGDTEFFEEGDYIAPVYLYSAPVHIDEDTLLLHFSNYGGDSFFVKWDLSVDETITSKIQCEKHQMGSIPNIDHSSLTNPLYQPEPISDDLLPLRAEADRLEDKYGIEIYIGQECGNIIGGYLVEPLTIYEQIDESLDILEQEMEKYPDNFFEQFEYSYTEGIDIYLAGTLEGIEEGNLDYAGGFATSSYSRDVMVIDCLNTYALPSTFHHELCHIIESKIESTSFMEEDPFFSDEKWNALNPSADIYTYSYATYGKEEYFDLAYDVQYYSDESVEDTCFIDTYAMTYPTEDRARIFENVMCESIVDFDEAPILKRKLEYYAECIRHTFDTTGWEEVPWELN